MQIYVLNRDGDQINVVDVVQSLNYATNLRYGSVYPRGYDSCSFRVRRRDVFAQYGVKEAYAVLVRDGGRQVWDGKIETIQRVISGNDEYIDITALGWYEELNQRRLQKRWHDTTAILHLVDGGNGAQTGTDFFPLITRRRDEITIAAAISTADITYDSAYHREQYKMPGGHYIKSAQFDYEGRTGEGFYIDIMDSSVTPLYTQTGCAFVNGASGFSGTNSETYSGSYDTVYVKVQTADNDYDLNDFIKLKAMEVKAKYDSAHSAYGSETYTLTELVEDCLLIAQNGGANISTDFTQLETITTALNGFCVEEPTEISEVIDRIAAYGTSSNETVSFSVWGRDGTSDNLPRAALETYPPTTDYEYVLSIYDQILKTFQNSIDTSQIYNYIWLQYTNIDGRLITLTANEYSGLADAASIATYGRRDFVLKIGKAPDDATALNIGYRFLDYHKDARYRGTLSVTGWILNKSGGVTPAGWIRAGQRVYIPRLNTTFVLRQVSYDAETKTATLSLDLPPDTIGLRLDNLRRQMATYTPQAEGVG